jgi:ATP-dependent DNA helicase RecG
VVAGTTLAALDPRALQLARKQFAGKFAQERWAAEAPQWSDVEFLDKAKLAVHGELTRAAVLLLGRPESARLLLPHPAELTWKLPDERVVEHFGPPFLLTTTAVMTRIRNPVVKLFPESQLIPLQLLRYEPRLLLEALHNCIAHQDYERCERIVVEERMGSLRLANAGGFIEGQPEDYFEGTRTPRLYRNHWLAQAMNNIAMIDKGGFGIGEMVRLQRDRFLPLPDYEGSDAANTVFNVWGQTLSAEYSRLLMDRPGLGLGDVLLLDRLQKGHALTAAQRKGLRERGLIEGRGARITISAGLARALGREPEYVDATGIGDDWMRAKVLKLLALGPQPRAKINALLLQTVPQVVVGEARRRAFIKDLLQEMARRGEIRNVGGATRAARWALVSEPAPRV